MTAAHAKLSASGSTKWLTCTPSARLEEQFPDERSSFADEGSFGHALAEHRLSIWLGRPVQVLTERGLPGYDQWFNAELSDYVDEYVEFVKERVGRARAGGRPVMVFIEQRLDFSPWVPQGFGTGDVVIVSERVIEVIDLKFGKGVVVHAMDNSQLRLYGLGAHNEFGHLYEPSEVRMTIVQPRLAHVSTEVLAIGDLLTWADTVVKPRAALAWDGLGEFVAGEHCSSAFCRARHTCSARAESNLAVAKAEFALQPPELLSMDQITTILARADDAIKWLQDVQSYALQQAEQGHPVPGWKLVEGRSNRRYGSADEVAKRLADAGIPEAAVYERSLLGVTAMERALGKKKFGELLGDLMVKPSGKPTLVPVSDPRPVLSSAASAEEEFSVVKKGAQA